MMQSSGVASTFTLSRVWHSSYCNQRQLTRSGTPALHHVEVFTESSSPRLMVETPMTGVLFFMNLSQMKANCYIRKLQKASVDLVLREGFEPSTPTLLATLLSHRGLDYLIAMHLCLGGPFIVSTHLEAVMLHLVL